MLRSSKILTAAALALCCALAPPAAADPFTDSERQLVDAYNDQHSLGTPHSGPGPFTDSERRLVASPEVQGMVDQARSDVRAAPAVVEVQAPSGGFDWGDAGIGAAGMLALLCIGGGSALLIADRRRRQGVGIATH